MLTWNVTYRTKPGQRTAFYQALTDLGIRENSRREAGNEKYDYYFDAQDPAFQELHCQTEIFARFQVLKVKYCADVTIDKFDH